MSASSVPLALTMGEPSGIGPEIALKAWNARHRQAIPPFIYVGDPSPLHDAATTLGFDLTVNETDCADTAIACWADALPVRRVELAEPAKPGTPSPANASGTIGAIELAVKMAADGSAGGVVTCPIHKSALYAAGFAHPGHTEFLAELAGGGATPVMMLAVGGFRTVPITIHMSLACAIAALTADLIVETATIVNADLGRFFGLNRPRLAISGLNPHAGEDGTMGTEEATIIAPAIARLKAAGIDVAGPLPADSMFHAKARTRYDAALCMYHDQALIPVKTVGFEEGVNCTLGLPFVRTSPDHGTALDIAGRGLADARSLIAALEMAARMAAHGRTA
ncbi:MAG: 4-hydroxythreonine-4-phosphate dehydrogenase PdxA [Hyphomicrobiales bacterium]